MNFRQAGFMSLEFTISENPLNWHQWTCQQTRKLSWMTRQWTGSRYSCWALCAFQDHPPCRLIPKPNTNSEEQTQHPVFSSLSFLSILWGVCVVCLSVCVSMCVSMWVFLANIAKTISCPDLELCLYNVYSVWKSQAFLNWVSISVCVALFDPRLLCWASKTAL